MRALDETDAFCHNDHVTETPEQRVARLERELAQAKVVALQMELDAARGGHFPRPTPTDSTWLPGYGNMWKENGPRAARPDARLAPAPRAVPSAFKLLAFPFSFWTLFTLLMVTVAPIALWIFVPLAGAVAAALTFVAVAARTLRRTHLRNSLLKWGEVATVTNADLLSRGTYYSGTTYSNVRLAQAHGWTVERRWYSGPGSKTRIEYQVGSGRGELTLHGMPYDNGVILADPRNPARALCVSAYPYTLERDASGNWVGQVPTRVLVSSVIMTLILVGWTAAMIWFWADQAASLSGLVRPS
ncbi:MAG: hypothetical protein QOG01_3284 [Pseudonocardiales bacterium]|nr:hypothetical protein [Pseudonocardiales bacterium]